MKVSGLHTYFVGQGQIWVHNTDVCPGVPKNEAKPLAEWLKESPELLDEARAAHRSDPEWQGIDPDKTDVFYRSQEEVDAIRSMLGESGGHHPHGLALGGPKGQRLTPTGETRTSKNPKHSWATAFQNRLIKIIKNQK